MATQGQSFFRSGGRQRQTVTSSHHPYPAEDPYITAVGGTDLHHHKAAGAWKSESRVGRRWRRNLARQDRDPYLADAPASSPLPTRARRRYRNGPDVVGERELHLLHLRRPDHLPGQRLRRHQLCGAMWAGYIALVNQQAGQPSATRPSASSTPPSTRRMNPAARSQPHAPPTSTTSPAAPTAAIPRSPATTWSPAGAARTAPA